MNCLRIVHPYFSKLMAGNFFIPIRNVIQKILDFDVDEIALEITRTNTFKRLVISLNTEGTPTSQLFELGQDATGKKLSDIGGEYSPFTLQEAQRLGRPKKSADLINLKNEGDFYASFIVIPFKGGFRIEADTIKDGEDLEDDWGKEIVGISPDNLQLIIEFYKNAILEKVKEKVQAA